ncbi:MAG TPA: type II toxin-antitoxin system prevent-host-death family antitoxin [Solirubrobacterales bacterium]
MKLGFESSPASSTLENDDAPTHLEVGAHEFRNRFGYYLERASAGTEVLVRRRGRPFAKLGPPV